MHGSKGLEYPIVFFVDTGSKISDKDARTRVVYKEDFGIAMYLRSEDGLALVKNPVREAINTEAEKRNFEEELRVLYVALTRARERLYISGERSRSAADFDGEIELLRRSLDEHSAGYIKSHLAVMLVAGAEYTEGKSFAAEESENTVKCEEKVTKIENFEENDAKIREAYDTLVERFSFSYPNKYLTEIPEKLSVSKLYPAVLDGTDGTAAVLFDVAESEDAGYKKSVPPRFIGGRTAAETSALCGIATHLYLQFCDMDRLKEFGTDAELSRLLEKEFLSAEDAKGVRLDEIELFRKSELIDRIRGAKNVWRELRFNIRLPAESFTREPDRAVAVSGEKILVQGVIDCIIENPDGSITLIDYKTDRLTKEELSDRSLAERKLQARYSGQLSYYKQAVLKMFGREPDTVEIYSLPLGDTVEISALAKK